MLLRRLHQILGDAGIESPEAEARWLLGAATGKQRLDLLLDEEIEEADEIVVLEMAANRIAGQPLQYLTGLAGFRRLDLHVGPGVFIPRPETELVAERAMELLVEHGRLLDLGTGSGAIALAVADERPDATIYATEISPDALTYARKNRDDLGLQIELIESDLFEGLPQELFGGVDVIVSNPPYVAWSHRHRLPAEVVEHEPPEALFAPGEGRTVIGSIIGGATKWLRPGGWLVLEIAEDQGPEVADMLANSGFADIAINKDLNERDRIAQGRLR